MTTHVNLKVALDKSEQMHWKSQVVSILAAALLGSTALALKEPKVRRTYGTDVFFARSGKREIFVSVRDKDAEKFDDPESEHVFVSVQLGFNFPDVSEEKLVALTSGLVLLGSGLVVSAETAYAGKSRSVSELVDQLRRYDAEADVEPAVELAPGESPF